MMTSASKFAPEFQAYLQDYPDDQVAAIIRCEQLDPIVEEEAAAAGLVVQRRLRLIRGLAVEGQASALLQIAEAPWVQSIEPDQPVHTMRR